MTNDQMRIEATKALMLYMSVNVPAEDITLLEANMDGTYIYFAIRGAKPAYALNRSGGRSSFRIYPSFNSYDGLILEV